MRGTIDHLDLTVRDPAKSRSFYEVVLGYRATLVSDSVKVVSTSIYQPKMVGDVPSV
jgi:predicted enzyme related to lactoylglutathione lyase